MVTSVAQTVAAGLFGTLARALGTRPLHPAGVAFAAELVLDTPALPGVPLFAVPGRRPAFVRFSRGFGLPDPLPEVLSLAIMVPDAGNGRRQDLLMAATGEAPVLRHVFAPGRSHLACRYSTVIPFGLAGRRGMVGAVPRAAARAPGAGDLGELEVAAAAGELVLDLQVATLRGPWRTVARLEAGRRLGKDEERDLRFNSDHAGGGITPDGFVNAVRGAAYAAANHSRP